MRNDTVVRDAERNARQAFDNVRPALDFLRRHISLVLLWPAVALAIGVVGWIVVLSHLDTQRDAQMAQAERQAVAYARTYADRANRAVGEIDRLLLLLRHQWSVSGSFPSLTGTLEAGIFSPQYTSSVAFLDSGGAVVTASPPALLGLNFAARPYFTGQRDAGTDQLYISKPLISLVTGREILVFSRRLAAPGGQFSGIVLIAVLPSYFARQYADLPLSQHSMVALVDRDGAVHANRVGDTMYPSLKPLLRAPLPERRVADVALLDGQRWFSDGRTRIVGMQPVAGTGLVAVAGLDLAEAMEPYERAREAALTDASRNTAWLLLATLLVTGLYVHAWWGRHQIEAIRATYRLATEHTGEGFFIHRPLHDADGSVCDYEIVDCNQYGAAMFGLDAGELVGHRLSEFYRGDALQQVLARMDEAFERGVHESEIQVPPNQWLKAERIRYRVVRSDGDLAVTLRDISGSKGLGTMA